jgi:hypothetical protein
VDGGRGRSGCDPRYYEQVTLRYCTLDPGGLDTDGTSIAPVSLLIRGYVETLVIDRCVLGGIRLESTGTVENVIITDSIVQSTQAGVNALDIGTGTTEMARVTIFGRIDVLRLYATDCLVAGVVDVTDTQDGCFRFSAAGPGSRLPHPYETVELDAGTLKRLFVVMPLGSRDMPCRTRLPASILRGVKTARKWCQRVGASYKRTV